MKIVIILFIIFLIKSKSIRAISMIIFYSVKNYLSYIFFIFYDIFTSSSHSRLFVTINSQIFYHQFTIFLSYFLCFIKFITFWLKSSHNFSESITNLIKQRVLFIPFKNITKWYFILNTRFILQISFKTWYFPPKNHGS